MLLLKILVILFITVVVLTIIIGYLLSVEGYKGPISDHFDGKVFINPSGKYANDLSDVFKYGRTRKPDTWEKGKTYTVRWEAIPKANPNEVQYIFVNHSTFLIQYQGINILTDPVWSKRCSPFQFAGPARQRPPGVKFEDLPEIHLVLLSHNHYDHFDKNTILRIIKKWDPNFIVPLGLSPILKKYGTQKVAELDWWQKTTFKNLAITATPANHFSSRGIFDRDKTLWAGFVIASEKKKIYFLGDSGYSDIFKTIGERLGPFDLSFIPIGAYLPKWFMSPIHVSPEESVRVHQDVRSKQSVAMHFGTFKLADDGPERSTGELRGALKEQGINERFFLIPSEGEVYKYKM